MAEIRDDTTIGAVFAAAVGSHADRPFLAIPANDKRGYLPEGLELSYAQAGARVDELAAAYASAGYGLGHRVATLLENRPEHILHTLALNGIGVCCVPINPDYRAGETAYLLEHSKPDLVLTLGAREAQVREALAQSGHNPPVALAEYFPEGLTKATRPAAGSEPTPQTPANTLYTSGTTGRPKGCILSHGYEVAAGAWYASLGGMATLREGQERIYNPLPLYHINSGVVSLLGAILTGNCQIQPDRFHPQAWWREIAQTRATIVHYLGIIAPLLLGQPASDERAPAWRALRSRRRHRAAAARAVRGALRLPADRAVGHDGDGAGAVRQCRAAPGRHARLRPRRAGRRGARGR